MLTSYQLRAKIDGKIIFLTGEDSTYGVVASVQTPPKYDVPHLYRMKSPTLEGAKDHPHCIHTPNGILKGVFFPFVMRRRHQENDHIYE